MWARAPALVQGITTGHVGADAPSARRSEAPLNPVQAKTGRARLTSFLAGATISGALLHGVFVIRVNC